MLPNWCNASQLVQCFPGIARLESRWSSYGADLSARGLVAKWHCTT